MDSKKLNNLERRGILPGFADGRYEGTQKYDPSEFAKTHLEDPLRRDNRVSIRVSGQDMRELHRMALAEGLPLQSLLAQIVHQYATGQLGKAEQEADLEITLHDPLTDVRSDPLDL
jgi:predicted DNA binding CopG/RHH family protein